MKLSINTLYFPNSNQEFVNSHKSVMNHFGVKVNYHEMSMRHGHWMNQVMETTNADVVGFLDIDCIPLTSGAVNEIVKYVAKNKSIAGCAQATNHIAPMSHIFVAPCCFFIWKPLWVAMGKPTFVETNRSDVCEEVCYTAESLGVRAKALYPTYFEREPEEGAWRLHNYGLYGVGTVFANKFYHLYQSRFQTNVDLFIQRCKEVIDGTFTTDGMHDSQNFDFEGKIACFPQEHYMSSGIKYLL